MFDDPMVFSINPASAEKVGEIASLRGTTETQAVCDAVSVFHTLMGAVDEGGQLFVRYPDSQVGGGTCTMTLPPSGPARGERLPLQVNSSTAAKLSEIAVLRGTSEPQAACDAVSAFRRLVRAVHQGGQLLVHYPERAEQGEPATFRLALPEPQPAAGQVDEREYAPAI